MTRNELIEAFKALVIENDLPRTDLSLLGLRCPYCGKSDRIRELEAPQDLTDTISPERIKVYSDLRQRLICEAPALGVCKFCQNPLALRLAEGRAEPL